VWIGIASAACEQSRPDRDEDAGTKRNHQVGYLKWVECPDENKIRENTESDGQQQHHRDYIREGLPRRADRDEPPRKGDAGANDRDRAQ